METKTEMITLPKSTVISIISQLEEQIKPQATSFIPPVKKWQDIQSFAQAAVVCPPDDFEQAVLNLAPASESSNGIKAFVKLSIISKAMNKLNNKGKTWVPDWSNDDEIKYYPYLEYKAGSGFSANDYNYVGTHTCVGSRLCFMTEEMARHAGEIFNDLYNDLFTI